MDTIVLDASALLAMLLQERGGDQVEALLLDPNRAALVSALNWSEVFDRLLREGYSDEQVGRLLDPLPVRIADFTRRQARIAAGYRIAAPALSLADRACLALAAEEGADAWTADRLWSRVRLPVKVQLVR